MPDEFEEQDDEFEEEDLEEATPLGPPAGTTITLERFPDGVTIQVPPAGVWKGSKGLFSVAVLLIDFMLAITLCVVGLLVGGNPQQVKQDDPLWILPFFFSLFWAVGIGLLLAALNMGWRRAVLAVTGGSLMVLQTGLFGSKRKLWEAGEVEGVRTGPSGMEINKVPVLQLHILDGGGKFGMLTGRSDEELEWIAEELRTALKVGRQPK
jgi:hypothetical protein